MKNKKGVLLLDFAIQSLLIGGILFFVIYGSWNKHFDYEEVMFITYLILGGWQYFFSLYLHFGNKEYSRRAAYVKNVSIMLAIVLVTLCTPLAILAMFFMLVVPPFIALFRYVDTFMEVRDEVDTDVYISEMEKRQAA